MFAPFTVTCRLDGANTSPVPLGVKVYFPLGNAEKLKMPELAVVVAAVFAPVSETLIPAPSDVGLIVPVALHVDDEAEVTDRGKLCFIPLALATKVALWVTVTAGAFAVNPILVAVAGTVTEPGKVTIFPAGSVLPRLTNTPPVGAAEFSVTVHEEEPGPTIDEGVQESPLTPGSVVVAGLT